MNVRISKWQKDFIDRIDDPLCIAVCGIGSGKSYILSTWIVLTNLREKRKTIAIAQTYKALDRVLFAEITKRLTEMNVAYTFSKSEMKLGLPNGSTIYGYSAENAVSMLGLTGVDTLAIDEAAYVTEDVFNYAKDRMRGSSNKTLTRLISSPNNFTKVSGWFKDLALRNPGCVVHASTLDNPFISESFKDELRERYIEGSELWRQQVLGEIFETAANDVLLHKCEIHTGIGIGKERFAGYDASGLGNDTDVLTVVAKDGMIGQWVLDSGMGTIAKANWIRSKMKELDVAAIRIDNTGGYGQGVLDLLIANGMNAVGVNFAQKADNDSEYPNKRTEMHVEAAKAIRNGFAILNEKQLITELCANSVIINGKGQQQLAPKEMIKKALGCSPDKADSLALAIDAMRTRNKETTKIDAAGIAMRYLNSLRS